MEVLTMEQTTIYLNTWGAYNDGSIGYGWMTPEQARDFIEADPERDGGEWFIADIDNYTGVEFGSLEYCNVDEIIDTIETLNNMKQWERDEIAALMEYLSTNDVEEAINKKDYYTIFTDIDQYHDSCDELLEFSNNSLLERYFDYESYHRDCDFDIYEASNGVCILN
jgi:antirestriction protein